MHIKSIKVNNFIGIQEVNKDLSKINKVTGDTGQGKTSLIEAIEKAFTNINRRTEVVKHGCDEASIFIELDDGMSVERKVRTEKLDYLKVKHDSKGVSSTEAYLRKFIKGDIFRPLEFVKKDSKEQAKIILNMLDIPWSVEDIKSWFGEVPEADYTAHILQILKQIEGVYYAERVSVNREINILKANIEGIKKDLPPHYDGEQWKDVVLADLYRKVTDAEENNKNLAQATDVIGRLQDQIKSIEQTAENDKESKRLLYQRTRDNLNKTIQDRDNAIITEQTKINDADRLVNEENIKLDNELQMAIERLKMHYVTKKQIAKDTIMQDVEQAKVAIQEFEKSKSTANTTLINTDELEKKDLQLIEQDMKSKIEQENTKAGNAQKIIDNTIKIEIEPLREKANEATKMKECLREWQRMNDIIREKISPKEERSMALTAKIEKARQIPQELLKTAAIPVEGLEVDAQGMIRINGTLLDGLSEGEQIEFAFKFAKAQAGELKVICIDGIQNLGSKSDKLLQEAMTDDFQYFILETTNNGEALQINSVEV